MNRTMLIAAAVAAVAIPLLLFGDLGLSEQGSPAPLSLSKGSLSGKGPQVVLDLPWGTGGWNVGKRDAEESAPVGPMSFTVAPSGAIHVLDQVNLRVLVFEAGAAPREVPIASDAFQDIEVGPGGELVLLDRLVRGSVVVIDAHGKELGSVGVVGPGIPEGGGVTAMLLESDGLWLEYGHERSVRVLDGSLAPCTREIRPGRMHGNGTEAVVASLQKPAAAIVRIVDGLTGATSEQQTLHFGRRVHRIAWVETDGGGNVHCMFHLAPTDGQKPLPEKILGLKLGGSLERLGSFESPFCIREWEQFREFEVGADGSVYQMALTDGGAKLLEWRYEP